MIDGKSVAVVVPAYRVEREIARVITEMPAFVDRIIVVDDASPDATAEVVGAIREPRLQLIRHAKNQGVGGAVATGFQAALEGASDLVVKCDGDGQMDPRDVGALIRPLLAGRAEYAKGCRFHHFRDLASMPRIRLGGNIALTFLTKLASGYWHVLDPQNGFLAIRADVLRRLPLGRLARGYFFENDMLIRLNALEARVADVPIPSRYGEETSSLRPGRAMLEFPLRLVAGFFRRVFWRYLFYDVSPVALFVITGAVLFLFGTLFGAYYWVRNATRNVATPTGTVILAAMPIILGFQLLLQGLVLDVQNSPRAAPVGKEDAGGSTLDGDREAGEKTPHRATDGGMEPRN
ncbi:MAG TPA: glycosyltransferase family 2 protein [Thermoanaerobaculia bacterium]|nr:glycosyltransferase family 2 protein [Thermoanaerobaculia bacterium]